MVVSSELHTQVRKGSTGLGGLSTSEKKRGDGGVGNPLWVEIFWEGS